MTLKPPHCRGIAVASALAACASHASAPIYADFTPANGHIGTDAASGSYRQDPGGPVDRHGSFRVGLGLGVSVDENQPGLDYQGEVPLSIEVGKRLTPEFELGVLFHRIGGDLHSQDFGGGVEEFEQRTLALNSRFYLQEIGNAEPWLQLAVGASAITYDQSPGDDSPFLRAGLGISKPLARSFLIEPSVSASTVFDSKDPNLPVDLSVNLTFSLLF